MIIDNKLYDSESKLSIFSPYSGKLVGKVGLSSPAKVKSAVESSVLAYNTYAKKQTPYERYQVLNKAYEGIKSDAEKLAALISNESGKVIRESRAEVQRALSVLMYAAEEAKRIHGQILPCDITAQSTGKNAYVHHLPLGVIAAITPFNFPLNTVVHKVAPAIASGNCVVLKPSEKTPLTAEFLADIFIKAGIQPGIFNVVQGGADVGEALVTHDKVRMVSFTGSVAVGKQIAKLAGMKKITLELGGNDPLIVFADGDLDLAAEIAIEQGLGTCGQRCTAVKRIWVEESVENDFLERLIPRVRSMKIGDPLDPTTDIGPMISEAASSMVARRVDGALKLGAQAIISGRQEKAVHSPVVLNRVNLESELIQEETFGPVLPILSFQDMDQAIRQINDTPFGLQAGVITNNFNTIKKLFGELEVGALIVNGGPGFRVDSLPFGGVKDSGIGREGIIAAIQEMCESKTLIF